jgi:hypothetical protein
MEVPVSSLFAIPVRGGGRRLVTVVALLAMVVPALVIAGVRGAAASPYDHPSSWVSSPTAGALVGTGSPLTVQGGAVNGEAGGIVGVEISLDGGTTWHPTQPEGSPESWSYTFTPAEAGVLTLVSRAATADVVEDPTTSVTIKVATSGHLQCPCFMNWPTPGLGVHDEDDAQPVELGLRFESLRAGYVTGLLFKRYPDNTGPHVAHLWDGHGNLLAEATLDSTGDAYPYIRFDQPVPITPYTGYTVSYYTPTGHYASTELYFSGAIDDFPRYETPLPWMAIWANSWTPGEPGSYAGVYHYGEGGGFPDETWHASNYWVEPVFTTS